MKKSTKHLPRESIGDSYNSVLVTSTVDFRFKEVPFSFLILKKFDLRKILYRKSKNGDQKKSLKYVGEFAS